MVSNDLLYAQKKKRSLLETRKTGDTNLEQAEKNAKSRKISAQLFENKESGIIQKREGMDSFNPSDHPCFLRFLFSKK
jgi:hypothetical protein